MSKVLKAIGKSIHQMCFDFVDSFKVKPWKICTILFLVPGLLIGLFLNVHADALNTVYAEYGYVGFILFATILLGCINIFNAFSFSSKRSLFMAIFSTIITILLVACVAWYTMALIKHSQDPVSTYKFTTDSYISLVVVWFSAACAVVASVLTYFFIDHNRVKD